MHFCADGFFFFIFRMRSFKIIFLRTLKTYVESKINYNLQTTIEKRGL